MSALGLALAYFLGAVVAHAAWVRVRPGSNRVVAFLGAGTLVGLGLLAHLAWLGLGLDALPSALAGTLAYAFACELYIFTFTLVTNSVTVGLLLDPSCGVDEGETADGMVSRRLDALVGSGFLRADGEGYAVTGKGRFALAIYRGLRAFFRHAPRA